MINTKLQNIIDTKSAIGNAIVNKGGTITSETPFYNYAAQIDSISTGGGAYSTFVAQAQNNAKYTVYNGYDFLTNPTPNLSNNFAFNQWALNNSATGDVILSNVLVANIGTFNGVNSVVNQSIIPFAGNSVVTGAAILSITTNNGFIYAGGFSINGVLKYNESTLALVGNTAAYGGDIRSITTNNGFIYVGGDSVDLVRKYNESTLALVGNTSSYGNDIYSVATNNGFIYVGGHFLTGTNRGVTKFHEGNLAFVGANLNTSSTANYGNIIQTIAINNGFIYAAGNGVAANIRSYNESNLAFINNSANLGGAILSIAINNGFIYAGGATNLTVRKLNESTLAVVGNTASYGGTITSITINNGFIYVGGGTNNTVQKFYESNLAFVGNSNSYGVAINTLKTNNGFIYAGGVGNADVKKYYESGVSGDFQDFYNITTIKE
jgi:hypothetical protein